MTSTRTLGDWMETRRAELESSKGHRLTWDGLAREVGIARNNLLSIRNGRSRPSRNTALHIERVFEWTQGSVDALDRGEEPIRLEDQAAAREELLRASNDEVAETIVELAKHYSDADLARIVAKVYELRSRRGDRRHDAG